ncbi:MAG: hypothetical protein ACLU9S_06015 [Oscillospiraceae bacterium]
MHTATREDWPAMVSIIARSYENMQMDLDRLADYAASPVYHPALWILVRDGNRDDWARCGIAELDRQIGSWLWNGFRFCRNTGGVASGS